MAREQMRYARGVRTARIAAGMTQRELGEAVGISAASVNQFEHETSSVSDETLGRICESLGTDRAGLLAQGGPAFVPALAGFGTRANPAFVERAAELLAPLYGGDASVPRGYVEACLAQAEEDGEDAADALARALCVLVEGDAI